MGSLLGWVVGGLDGVVRLGGVGLVFRGVDEGKLGRVGFVVLWLVVVGGKAVGNEA